MAKKNHPRRGSLAYKPQRRAPRLYGKIKTPNGLDDGAIGGFAGYKVGMTRILRIDDEYNSPTKGQEIADAVTVVEVPPLVVFGVRAYSETVDGEQPMTEMYADNLESDLARAIDVPADAQTDASVITDNIDDMDDLRLLVHTQPSQAGFGKKTPEVFEVPLGGKDVAAKWESAQELLGGEIAAADVFEDGAYTDVIGVTKGQGFSGAVKKHGIKTLGRKTQKSSRKAGNIGPFHPDHTSWKIPQPGRAGANNRTEHNKRVLEISDDLERINPDGGFKHYGQVTSSYLLVKGSVPGPAKRLVMFRPAVRKQGYPENPNITYVKK